MTRSAKYDQIITEKHCRCVYRTVQEHGDFLGGHNRVLLDVDRTRCPLHSDDGAKYGLPPEFP